MNLAFKPIEKENIEGLNFPATDVLTDPQEIVNRKGELENAMAMGNIDHVKIAIFFEDDKDLWVTNTTIWAVTPEHIVLKKGVTIPINRIYRIM
ncbi:hypothetical protein SAMN02927937_02670 [Paenimyroides aquimaris]|uniref:Uncharacterized protein n=1 Tax=Paenimyroides marinum TaxID=1159016 RepID=A0A1H6MM48_9FLAO|nr:hypothetical protein [Paenimyroides aquimaris]SEI00369.1 hypothetical protein SAMN02927937_02670 [Paenimyroides aquimaris]